MNLLVIGDLHVHEWGRFGRDERGVNKYLRLVEKLFKEHIPAAIEQAARRGVRVEGVVFLGDLVEEPTRTGKIAVAVQNFTFDLFASLRDFLPESIDIYVISGNHDQTAGKRTWVSALSPYAVVIDDVHTEKDAIFVAYDAPAYIEDVLRNTHAKVVFGHFAYEGAVFDNGEAVPSNVAVSADVAARFSLNVLGHIHAPQQVKNTLYVGSPYRFSYHARDTEPRHLYIVDTEAGEVVTKYPIPSPVFVRLDSPQVKDAELKALPEGSFVRIPTTRESKMNISKKLATLKEKYPHLNFDVYVLEENEVPESRLRIALQAAIHDRWQAALLAAEQYLSFCEEHAKNKPPASVKDMMAFFRSRLLDKARRKENK